MPMPNMMVSSPRNLPSVTNALAALNNASAASAAVPFVEAARTSSQSVKFGSKYCSMTLSIWCQVAKIQIFVANVPRIAIPRATSRATILR